MKTTVREKTYEVLPPGIYQLIADNVTVAENKTTKEQFLSWQFRVIDQNSEYYDKTFTFGAPMNPSKKAKVYEFYLACGLEDAEGDQEIDTDMFKDIPFYAEVTVENNKKGEEANRVKWFKSKETYEAQARKALGLDRPVQKKAVSSPAKLVASAPATRPASNPVGRPVTPVRSAPATPPRQPAAPVEEEALDFPTEEDNQNDVQQ